MSDISFTNTNEGIPEDARYWMEKDKANAKAMTYTPDPRVVQSQRAYQSAYGADIDPDDILPDGKGIRGISNMDEIEQFRNELPTFLQMVNESNRTKYEDTTLAVDSKLGNFVRGAYQNAETKEQLESWEFASILSEMTGLSVRFCKDNEKDLIKTYTGRDIDRSNFVTGLGKSFWSRVMSDYASVKARVLNSQLSDMNERQRQIAIDDFMDNELPQLSYYWNPDMYGYKDSVLGKVAYFTFENLPSIVESQITGLLAGGIGSVAKAAKGVVDFAYNLTRVASVFEKESGSALLGMWSTLNDNGQRMDWQTMNTASTQIGMVNTAFEFGLEKMLGAVGVRTSERWGRNIKDMFSKYGRMSSKNVMDAAIETTGKYIAKGVWNNAKNALGEATTEAMQTWSEDFFTNLAYRKSKGFGDYVMSHSDILKDMAQTFAYTAASTFLEAPFMLGQDSDAFSVYGYVRDRKKGRIVSIGQVGRYSTKTDASTLASMDRVSFPSGTKATDATDTKMDGNAKVYRVGDTYIPASKEDASKLAGIKDKTKAAYVDVVNQEVQGAPIDFNTDSTMQGYASRSNAKVSGDTLVTKDLDRTVANIMKSDGFVSAQLLKEGSPTTNGDFDEARLSIRDSNGELRTMAVVDESTAKARGMEAVSVESTDSAINQSIKDRRNASQDAQTAQRIASARKLTQKEIDNTFNSYVSDLDRKDKAYVNRLRRNTEAMVTELYGDRKDAKAIASVSTSLLVDFAKLNGMDVRKYVDTRLGGADSRFMNIMTKADAETSGTSAFIQRNDNGTWTVNLYNAPNSQTQLIHEFSHMFLSTLGNESVVDRFKSIYRDEYESGGIMGKEFQERFATDLEAYVVSGKAKSKGLRAVFETIVRAINNFGKLIRGIDFDNKADAMAAFDELFSDERLNQTKRNASTVERLSSIVESIDRAYETVSKLDSADSEDMVFSMDYLKEIATQLEDSDAQDRAGLWSEFRDTASDLRDYLDATASEDSVVQSLADSLSEESISEILKVRPLATSDTDIMNAMYRMRYGKNVDFKRSDVSILVPYTTEQTIQRITIGKPVESADIVTLLETDTQMSKYQRNVLKKELEAIRILTSDPILNETILKAYEEKRNAYDAYDLVVQRMKELDPSFAFRSKRDGLDLIRRAVAHSEWHTTDTLNADFLSTFSKDRNANIDRLVRTLIGNGYLYNELRDMPMTALRRIADLTSDGLKVSEATYDNAYAEITDPYNTTTLRRASEGGVVYEDADSVYSPSSVKVDAKRFAESLHDSTLPDEYRDALKEGSYNEDMLDRLDEYVRQQSELASKTEESQRAYEDLKASYEKDMDTMVSELEDSYAEIERLNSIKAKLEQDYRNKVLEASDYASKKTELERQLSLAKAKYARYVGRQRSNALNAEIRRESVSNRETQDHTLGRDRTLLYADLIHSKKEIAKAKADGKPLQIKSDIQENFPALYDWLQSKGMFSGKEIIGNLKQLSVKDRQTLLGLIKDYKAMSVDTLNAREKAKKSKASSDAVLMKRNMKIDNRWSLDEAETAEVSRKVDENIAKMMKSGELASDADIQAIRETMMLDAVGKAERSKSRTEARPGNTEYRRSTKEGMLTKMKAAYDIPRHILRGMGRNIELLTMGGYDENGVEHIGIEQLYTKQLQAEQKRREGFTQSVVENFGDELKRKGKVTPSDMARIFGNDKTILTDYSTPLFTKIGEGKDAEYTATKKVMDKMLSKDESVARTATALFELAVLQDKAKFSNGDEIFSYNLNERMALYVLMKQPYTMKSLWHGNNLSASQLFQVFSSFVDAEEGSKMSRAKRFADYIQKDAAGSFDRINPISIERDNKDLKESRVMDYFGLVFENSPMYDEMKLSFQDEGHRTSDYSLSDGFLQNRDGTARALSLDLLSNWERQMQKQEHFIAFAGFMDNMSRVMLDNGMFNDIRRNNGEVAADWFSGFMKSVADGATKVNTTTDTVSKSFGWMRSNLAKAALAFNITPVLTQPATLAYAIAEGIPVSYMLSSMKSNIFDYDATTRMIYELSPQMKEQSRLDVDIAKATSKLELDTRKGRIQHYIDSVAQAGMKPMELLDRMVKNTLWLAKYNDVYDKLMSVKENKPSEEYSRKRAAMEADVFVLDTQTNNLAKNNPTAYKTNSDLLRSLQMFTSQSNKQFWYFRNGMTDAQKGQKAKAIAVNLFALSMTLALTCVARGKLIPKKDEDFDEWLARAAKDLGAEAFSMVPFVGNLASQFGTGWSASGDLPIADVASDAMSLLNTVTEEQKKGSSKTKWEKIQTDMKNLALDSAGFIGLPEQAVKKLYNAVSDENLFKALGYDWGELGDSYL